MSDGYRYSAETLLRLADCLWDDLYLVRASPVDEVRSRSDPGVQSDLPAMVADVRRAWHRAGLDAIERQIFICRMFWGMDLGTIAEVYDLTPQQVADALDVGTEELLRTINGRH